MTTLNVPNRESVRYERNMIKTCVCELRFPFLLELETKEPVQLQKILRKEFPLYEKGHSVEFNAPSEVKQQNLYAFRTRKKDWVIQLRAFSVSLETTAYTDFGEFKGRLQYLIEKFTPVMDTDFFTRVGLRYINSVPTDDGDPRGWVNDDLVMPLIKGAYGRVDKYAAEVRGFSKSGQYTFRHGLIDDEAKQRRYLLDYDYYADDVSIDATLGLVSEFNAINFSFFTWALGPKGKEWLGSGKPKGV